MSFEVTVTPTVYDVDVSVNQSVQPFDVEVTVGNVPDLDLTTNGDSGASTFDPLTGELNIPNYTLDGLGGVPESRTITINGTTQDLSANRTFSVPTHEAVTIGSPANGLAIDGNQVLTIGLASGSQTGALSSTDWTTFNSKQNALGFTPEDVANKSTDTGLGTSNSLYPSQGAVKSYIDTGLSGKENTLGFTPENVANKAINFTSPDDTKYPTTLAVSTALAGKQDVLTNPITGTGVAGQVAFWNGTNTQSGSTNLLFDNVTGLLTVTGGLTVNGGTTTPHIRGSALRVSNTANGASGRLTIGSINFIDGDSGTYYFRNSGNTLLSLFSNNNVAINTTTDAGFRLDVNGTARVQGALSVTTGADVTPLTISGYSLTGSNNQPALSITGTWNTTGTPTALLVNVTDTASDANSLLCAFRVGGSNRFFVRKDGTIQFLAASISNGGGFEGASYSTGASTLSSAFNTFNSRFNYTNTSGDTFQFIGSSTFTPTSGTGTITGFVVQNTINQTGGANGITRGLYVNPTLTSAADWRSIEWSNNTGWGLYGVGTANNYLNGKLLVKTNVDAGFDLDVNGTARVQGDLNVNGVNIGLGGGNVDTNTIVGLSAGLNNATGVNNSFFGRNAGNANTTGNSNSFFGLNAGRNNSTGNSNSFFGLSAGQNNTTGGNNSFFGLFAGQNNTTGNSNSFFGLSAGQNNTTGGNNSFFGREAGRYLADGITLLTIANNSVFLGFDTRANADNQTNQIVIGHTAIGLGSNTTVIGNSSTTFGRWWGSLLVGTSTNEASSILTLESTTKGFLPPRMTGAQAEAIASPAEGLLVYSTDGTGTTITSKGWWGFDGSTWAQLN